MMKRGEKGFTLIELMIVIAIIGILAAVAIPNFLSARGKAQDAAAKGTLEAMKTALEMYMASQGYYPQPADDALAALETAMSDDWPSNIDRTSTNPGALTGYRGDTSDYAVSAIGRDSSHYFHLTNAGTLTGPDSNSSIDDP